MYSHFSVRRQIKIRATSSGGIVIRIIRIVIRIIS